MSKSNLSVLLAGSLVVAGALTFKAALNRSNPGDLKDALNDDAAWAKTDGKQLNIPEPSNQKDEKKISCGEQGTLDERIKNCRQNFGRNAAFCGTADALSGIHECADTYINKLLKLKWSLVTRTAAQEVWLKQGGDFELWAFDHTKNPQQSVSALPGRELCGAFTENYFGKMRLPAYKELKEAGLLNFISKTGRKNKWFAFFDKPMNWAATLDDYTIRIPYVNEPSVNTICVFSVNR